MKQLQLTILASVFLFVAHAQTDFSGHWVIDVGKIEWGQAPHWVLPAGFNIKQGKKSITIERNDLDTAMNEQIFTEELLFEGTQATINTFFGKLNESLKWSDDKSTFIITSASFKKDGTAGSSVTERWSLEDDGEMLQVERHVEQADGFTYTIQAYFDKK